MSFLMWLSRITLRIVVYVVYYLQFMDPVGLSLNYLICMWTVAQVVYTSVLALLTPYTTYSNISLLLSVFHSSFFFILGWLERPYTDWHK